VYKAQEEEMIRAADGNQWKMKKKKEKFSSN